jgi:hypothetical protein
MKITITIDQKTLCDLVKRYINDQLGTVAIGEVRLLVKSNQNYKSEWEPAAVLVTNDQESAEWKQAEKTTLKAIGETK